MIGCVVRLAPERDDRVVCRQRVDGRVRAGRHDGRVAREIGFVAARVHVGREGEELVLTRAVLRGGVHGAGSGDLKLVALAPPAVLVLQLVDMHLRRALEGFAIDQDLPGAGAEVARGVLRDVLALAEVEAPGHPHVARAVLLRHVLRGVELGCLRPEDATRLLRVQHGEAHHVVRRYGFVVELDTRVDVELIQRWVDTRRPNKPGHLVHEGLSVQVDHVDDDVDGGLNDLLAVAHHVERFLLRADGYRLVVLVLPSAWTTSWTPNRPTLAATIPAAFRWYRRLIAQTYDGGSSPRMRGTREKVTEVRRGYRIIPAHAGNSRKSDGGSQGIPDHPRACGELEKK